ncbi:DsbA family protein [Crenobacter sp. SG2303]|uniref:DsbA family protein n=1 Tax=Crenobacter oryzisoli TaxID=3056844 RepID=A0ABT7XUJ0_9NEIS|nr:DsbA family protein [Crenobacter sp. SG2303]MDN0077395.1 DsbA family protein [Crenobacter sp. SG2303]
MQQATLHYIYDPFCGWCYAAAPLVHVAASLPGLHIALHGGGMMAGANRQPVTDALRRYVIPHDQRIAALTGQPFGDVYFDGLLRDAGAVFDSEPPIAAVLAAESMAGRGLALLERLQRAHYVEGRRIAEPAALVELTTELGLDQAEFSAALNAGSEGKVLRHIAASRELLARVGGQGFPTLVLERGGHFERLELGAYLGSPDAWLAMLCQ